MRKLLLALAILLLAPTAAEPQFTFLQWAPATTAAFTGLCDQVTCANVWGLRAAKASVRGGNVVNVCHSDLTTCSNWATDATTGDLLVNSGTVTDCNNTTQKCYFFTFYDQLGSCNLTKTGSTSSVVAQLVLNAFGTKPGIRTNSSTAKYTSGCGSVSASQPYTFAIEANRTANFTTTQVIAGRADGNVQMAWGSSTNQMYLTAGGANQTFTVSDSTLHSVIAIYNGASASLTVDGTTTTAGATVGTLALSPDFAIFDYGGSGFPFQGDSGEIAFITSAPSAGTLTNICHNMRLYWGSGGSC